MWRPGGPQPVAVHEMVANIDIAPSIIDLAGIQVPEHMDGKSFRPLLEGRNVNWREELLYEYYWERNYPFTPTTHALITGGYKFIRYHGIWDIDELYDLEADPGEMVNLIRSQDHQDLIRKYRRRLFSLLGETGGNTMPLLPDRGIVYPLRHPKRSGPAAFDDAFYFSSENPVSHE